MEDEELTFYHGSTIYLEDGATLIPGCVCGNGDQMEEVYVTNNLGLAQQYATWDGYIYMVQPNEDLTPDIFHNEKPITFTCSSAKVLCCVW